MPDLGFERRLHREIGLWEGEGLITADVAGVLRARYEEEARTGAKRKLAWVLAFLGALLLGVGVIVFFAANWDVMPKFSKLLAAFTGIIACHACGFWLRYKKGTYPGTGTALIFLGTLLYGAAVFLIAQMLHINANAPILLVLWAVGAMPMAYLLKSRAMMVLGILSLTVALGWDAVEWVDGDDPIHFISVFLAFGALLFALGGLHACFEPTKTHGNVYASLGSVIVFSAMIPLSYNESWMWSSGGQPGGHAMAVMGLVAAGAIISALCTMAFRGRSSTALREAIGAGCVAVVALLLFMMPDVGTGFSFVINVALLAMSVGLVVMGYARRETLWVNLGLLYFAVLVIVRYVDWCWELLPTSAFFIGAGIVLVLGGLVLERARRKVTQEMKEARCDP